MTGDRAWRTVATLVCFAVFMTCSALVLPLFLPLALVSGRRPARQRVGKALTRTFFRLFLGLMRALRVLELEGQGLETLNRTGLFVVANHPTLIDFVLLAGFVPRADCLVKSSLTRHWAMRWPVRLAGYIPNDLGQRTLDLCRSSLDSGNSLVVFPEGTRTPRGCPPLLRRGAAQLALRCGRDVTQVVIDLPDSNLEKGGAWFVAPRRRAHVRVVVFPPLAVAPYLARHGGEPRPAARELTEDLQRRFQEVLAGGPSGA